MEKVSEEVIQDDFNKVSNEIEREWDMGGLANGIYEEFARAIYNRMITNKEESKSSEK